MARVHIEFDAVIVSCEHASNRVPARWATLFGGARGALEGHRGWDVGAAWLARRIARATDAPLHVSRATRLLVDLNRSLHHRDVFSALTAKLPEDEKRRIIDRHYAPYRAAVESEIRAALTGARRVLHLSVHSFTPRLRGSTWRADIGLLYDPARPLELALCTAWAGELRAGAPTLRVRRNYPYRGTSDGFSVALRRLFAPTRYACVELEVNQRHLRRPGPRRLTTARAIVDSLTAVAFTR